MNYFSCVLIKVLDCRLVNCWKCCEHLRVEELHHYNPDISLQSNHTAYLIYNDGIPKSMNYSRKYGHSKGMSKVVGFSFLLKMNILLNISSSVASYQKKWFSFSWFVMIYENMISISQTTTIYFDLEIPSSGTTCYFLFLNKYFRAQIQLLTIENTHICVFLYIYSNTQIHVQLNQSYMYVYICMCISVYGECTLFTQAKLLFTMSKTHSS